MSSNKCKIMKISQKLKELRKNINLTQQEFAAQIGVNTKTIAFWENDKNEPTKSNLLTICNKFNLSDDYFNENVKNNVRIVSVTSNEPKIKADYYPDVFGSCGGGAFVLSETKEQIEIPLKCFKKPFNKIKKYSVINAYGSSMQPFIFDADRLIIEHCEGETIQDDKVYVFAYDNQIFIKRLYYNVDEIIIKSDNPDPIFKVKYISKEQMNDFILIGQVVGIIRDCR